MGCGASTAAPKNYNELNSAVMYSASYNIEDYVKIQCQINKANNNSISLGNCNRTSDCNLYDQGIDFSTGEQGNYDILEIVEDLGGEDVDRGWSASSKDSVISHDSGFNDENMNIITESSESDKVQTVLDTFDPNIVIDLTVQGKSLIKQESANSRTQEEKMILQTLQETGLISRPAAQAPGGLCFDVITPEDQVMERKPPSRLKKLVAKKKRNRAVNQEMDENRKVSDKIRDQPMESPRSESALVSEELDKKMNRALKNRQNHISNIRKKLRQHDQHIDIVKQRRLFYIGDDDSIDNHHVIGSRGSLGSIRGSRNNMRSGYSSVSDNIQVLATDGKITNHIMIGNDLMVEENHIQSTNSGIENGEDF